MEDSLHCYEGHTPIENKEISCLQTAGKKRKNNVKKRNEKNTCMALKISTPMCETMQTPREQW